MSAKSQVAGTAGYKLMEITWRDHWSSSGWMTQEQLVEHCSKPITVTTVGYLTYEDNDQYVLCASVCNEDAATTLRQGILKADILKKKEIK